MKLRYQHNAFGPKVHCIDESEYDGAPDAGPQLVGQGDTQEEARRDFFEQWLNREALRDIKRGVSAMQSWDNIIRQVVGLQS